MINKSSDNYEVIQEPILICHRRAKMSVLDGITLAWPPFVCQKWNCFLSHPMLLIHEFRPDLYCSAYRPSASASLKQLCDPTSRILYRAIWATAAYPSPMRRRGTLFLPLSSRMVHVVRRHGRFAAACNGGNVELTNDGPEGLLRNCSFWSVSLSIERGRVSMKLKSVTRTYTMGTYRGSFLAPMFTWAGGAAAVGAGRACLEYCHVLFCSVSTVRRGAHRGCSCEALRLPITASHYFSKLLYRDATSSKPPLLRLKFSGYGCNHGGT